MTNFAINFTYPWLLLLLIPALALTLLPYLRANKKYRRNRNRIVSMVLHMVIMLCAISVLSGITFTYDIPNSNNELILLVDSSFSNDDSAAQKDAFVKSVLDRNANRFKVGVVTFGWNQVYAAELTTDSAKAYEQYLNAEKPDNTATDIASALTYARGLFTSPDGSNKIVLLTDGMQTDGNANTVIRSIAADGIKVDTAFFPTAHGKEAQLIDIETPDNNIEVGAPFTLKLAVQSSFVGRAYIALKDNGEEVSVNYVDLVRGVQVLEINHTFEEKGMHKLTFELDSNDDTLKQNNAYNTYIYLEAFEKILLVERYSGEANTLKAFLESNKDEDGESIYKPEIVNVLDEENMPVTLDALREYDQVILVNIANADMPEGFDRILHTYVHDVGGGLLTVGGNRLDNDGNIVYDAHNNIVPNAYNREDMLQAQSSYFKDMLPVQAIDYTPPLGLMIIIDRSGSMGGGSNEDVAKLEQAKEGAKSLVTGLNDRDWVGVMTLESTYSEEVEMIQVPYRPQILATIDEITIGGGTVFTGAIEAAGRTLSALKTVERKHIVLISDGQPGDRPDQYLSAINRIYDNFGITFSFVILGGQGDSAIKSAADMSEGRIDYYDILKPEDITYQLRELINAPAIKEVEYTPFIPAVKTPDPAILNGVEELPELDGYYGTKPKDSAKVILTGEYVPIYAQWDYGDGKVGSFMCDLSGVWSQKFMTQAGGVQFLNNVISWLFPMQNIRAHDINLQIREDNYSNTLSIFTALEDTDTIEVEIESPLAGDGDEDTQIITPTTEEGFTRLTFYVTKPGVHKVTVRKKAESGDVLSEYSVYKTFSYSKEYDLFVEEETCRLFLEGLAEKGKGNMVSDPWKVYEGFAEYLHKVFDPRLPLIITALVLFLLDIAVRKFKFKWPHELILEYREKKKEKHS